MVFQVKLDKSNESAYKHRAKNSTHVNRRFEILHYNVT